jgi:RNA polymerase sigma factor (sigma-70 family)
MVERHYGVLTGFATWSLGCPEAALDAVQTTYLKAWQAPKRPQPGEGEEKWLFRILRNQITDEYRRRSRRPEILADDPNVFADPAPGSDPEGCLLAKELLTVLMRIPGSTPEVLIVSIVLPRNEARQALGHEKRQYDVALSRARTRGRKHLKQEHVGYGEHF